MFVCPADVCCSGVRSLGWHVNSSCAMSLAGLNSGPCLGSVEPWPWATREALGSESGFTILCVTLSKLFSLSGPWFPLALQVCFFFLIFICWLHWVVVTACRILAESCKPLVEACGSSSPTRDQARGPCILEHRVLATGPAGSPCRDL